MFLSDTDDSWWSSLDTSDHSSITWSILLVNGLFFGLVALVVSLRIFTKVFTRFRLFADDCTYPDVVRDKQNNASSVNSHNMLTSLLPTY